MAEDGREVVIVDYDPRWPTQFEAEKEALFRVAGDCALAVHHVGSTSVPGLAAKPILDIVIELNAPLGEAAIAAISAMGYEYRGDFGIAGRQYFSRRSEPQSHLHCYIAGHAEVRRTLAFRNYLREHADAAREYEALKRRLAAAYRFERTAYTDAKTDFVRSIDTLTATEIDAQQA